MTAPIDTPTAELVERLVKSIDDLDVDELRAELRAVERAAAFIRGGLQALERFEEPRTLAGAVRLARELGLSATPGGSSSAPSPFHARGPALDFYPPGPYGPSPHTPRSLHYGPGVPDPLELDDDLEPHQWEQVQRARFTRRVRELVARFDYAETDAEEVARREARRDDLAHNRDGTGEKVTPERARSERAVGVTIQAHNERALAQQREGPAAKAEPCTKEDPCARPCIDAPVEGCPYITPGPGPVEVVNPIDEPGPEPTIVAGVDLPGLSRQRERLVELYRTVKWNALEARALAGDLDHELPARIRGAEEELARQGGTLPGDDPAPGNIAPAPEPPAPAQPPSQDPAPAAPSSDSPDRERLLPAHHNDSMEDGAHRLRDYFTARRGEWIGSGAAADECGVDKFRSASICRLLQNRGDLEHNEKGGAHSKYRAPLLEPEVDDQVDESAPIDVVVTRRPEVLDAAAAAAAVREQDGIVDRVARHDGEARPVGPARTRTVATEKPRRPDAGTELHRVKPSEGQQPPDLEGRLLSEFSYRPGTIAEIVERLQLEADDEKRAALLKVGKLVDEGELLQAGKRNGRAIYTAARPALV